RGEELERSARGEQPRRLQRVGRRVERAGGEADAPVALVVGGVRPEREPQPDAERERRQRGEDKGDDEELLHGGTERRAAVQKPRRCRGGRFRRADCLRGERGSAYPCARLSTVHVVLIPPR